MSDEVSAGGVLGELEELRALVGRLRSEVRAVHAALGHSDQDPPFGLGLEGGGGYAGARQVERARDAVEDMAAVVRDLSGIIARSGVEVAPSLPGIEAHEVTLSGGEDTRDCPGGAAARS
jgi:hypothetical protein